MSIKLFIILILVVLLEQYSFAQVKNMQQDNYENNIPNFLFSNAKIKYTDSNRVITVFNNLVCQWSYSKNIFLQDFVPTVVFKKPVLFVQKKEDKFLVIHGNISYDYFYRSKVDTPFNQQDLKQHSERINLEILVKNKYPLRVGFSARQSNSPYFRDLSNVTFNFDKYNYTKGLKQELLNKISSYQWNNPDLKMIDTSLKLKIEKLKALKVNINSPDVLQKLIEAKERKYFANLNPQKSIPNIDSLEIPSISKYKKFGKTLEKKDFLASIGYKKELKLKDSLPEKEIIETKKKINDLQNEIVKLKHQSDSIKNKINQKIANAKQLIYKAKTPKDISKIALDNGIKIPREEKIQNVLANIKSFGIGRSFVDYTPLTAKDIMLSGINVEYNPSYYAAFAAGTIDFGFRDFLGKKSREQKQYLTLGRFGWGNKDKKSIILTVFNGRKNNYTGIFGAANNASKLFGYSVEATIKKNENNSFTVEIAKSTKTNFTNNLDSSKANNLFRYKDNSNMGISFSAQTIIPETRTIISGYYRKTGEAFQSFSTFTYNTAQEAWQLRAEQSFLKKKINLVAMIRQNDFTNPLAINTFKTKTVFKSAQLNVRVPKWPVLNAGYYPGTQFYIVDENSFRENVYYILNGSLMYPYKYKDISMSSAILYNRFFNQSTDSGFVLYKGINYMITQSIMLKQLQLQGSYAYNKQAEINYTTWDAEGDYSFKKVLKLGVGSKFNHVKYGENYWGKAVRVGADLKKLGVFQFNYEKSYLPTIQQTLYPVEIGRVSWYKFF